MALLTLKFKDLPLKEIELAGDSKAVAVAGCSTMRVS